MIMGKEPSRDSDEYKHKIFTKKYIVEGMKFLGTRVIS